RSAAQDGGRFTLVVRDVPLQEALETLARTARINLVYPSELVRGHTASCALRNAPVEDLLRCLLAGTGLDFVRSSSGAYVILEARELPPRLGLLTGQVVDGTTGAPLPFAHVLLADAGTGTVTNEAGMFTISGLLAGPHRLVVSYVGYRPKLDSVWIDPDRPAHVRIALEPTLLEAPPIVIDGLRRRPLSAELGRAHLTAEQIQQTGTSGDLLHAVERLPGVQVPHPLAELHLQGGDSGEHLTRLDGMPIRNPVSLGRYLSAFSPLAIGRLTVHRAGYGVALGSQLAGLIDLEHDLNVPRPLEAVARVDPLAANVRLRGRYQDAAVLVALRQSLWDLYQEPGLRTLLRQWNTIDPLMAARWLGEPIAREGLQAYHWRPRAAFSDLHVAGRMQPDPFQTLHVAAYRGTNRLEAGQQTRYAAARADSARLILTEDAYRWLNKAFRLRFDRLLTPGYCWACNSEGAGTRPSITTVPERVRHHWESRPLGRRSKPDCGPNWPAHRAPPSATPSANWRWRPRCITALRHAGNWRAVLCWSRCRPASGWATCSWRRFATGSPPGNPPPT
uniref:carboxypeptidase-like regulatory domain-containing protein n=1 Tax=Rhodothermus marinus TaxID=29549 RepID=UPI000A58C593